MTLYTTFHRVLINQDSFHHRLSKSQTKIEVPDTPQACHQKQNHDAILNPSEQISCSKAAAVTSQM